MSLHQPQSMSLKGLSMSMYVNASLIMQMTRRDVIGRYKGSIMGILWSFLNPMLMLSVYTFVFSTLFKARWGVSEEDSTTHFAVVLFAGMIIHSLFSDVLNRSSGLILSHTSYVKKVVFPLEILPVIALGTALFHSLISFLVLLVAYFIFVGQVQWTALFLPCVLLPLVILTLGLAWIIASLGVFLRDISQTIGILTLVMMFLAPVMYPITAVPIALRPFIQANPLTFIIEQTRDVLLRGHMPNWFGLALYTLVALSLAWIGYAWFQKSRKWFADVL